MSKLYLFNYNNYFNRIIKKEASLADYGTPLHTIETTNFNPKAGVETTHDINFDAENGNYVIITETISNVETISSRWFVIQNQRLRGNQYRLSLRRDLIADYYNQVTTAPMILQKGMVKKSNNLIFNKEGFNVNQIKTDEIFLTDSHNDTAWIYLYCAKNAGDIKASVKTDFTASADIYITTPLSESIYASGIYQNKGTNIKFNTNLLFRPNSQTSESRNYEFNSNTHSFTTISTPNNRIDLTNDGYIQANALEASCNRVLPPVYNTLKQLFYESRSGKLDDETTAKILEANHKSVVDSEGHYYTISVITETRNIGINYLTDNDISRVILNQIQIDYPNASSQDSGGYGPSGATCDETTYTIVATRDTSKEYIVSIEQTTHLETEDSECNIIAIPYGDFVVSSNGTYQFGVTGASQLAMAYALAKAGTNAKVYDMQLLPYGPFGDVWNDADIDIYQLSESQYQIQKYNTAKKNILFYVSLANFEITMNKTLTMPTHSNNEDINYKVVNECDTWRLCSPNFNGAFEFNLAKNRGVTSFSIDISLKPYNPYIHINPVFGGLYGSDFNDARGLICGGDFSLPIIGDAFAQYELNNKNYQIAFDRQIQNLEFTQSQERILGIAGAISGTAQGVASGATLGAMTGNPVVAGAGAIGGGIASGVGGIADLAMLEARQTEAKSYAVDNFKYRLGNIKALPYSLNKVNPLTYNNKIFPFIEFYTCTDEEITAFINKITYSGMTLNVIGTIQTFKTNYGGSDKNFYRGEIIRLDNFNTSSEIAYEIYQEIEKGVYI